MIAADADAIESAMKLDELDLTRPLLRRWQPLAAALPGVSDDDVFRGTWTRVETEDGRVSFVPRRGEWIRSLLGLVIPVGVAWCFAPLTLPLGERVLIAAGVFLIFCLLTPKLLYRGRTSAIRIFDGPLPAEAPPEKETWLEARNIARLALLDLRPLDHEMSLYQLYAVTREPEQSYMLFQRIVRWKQVDVLGRQLAERWNVPCAAVDVRGSGAVVGTDA